MRIMDLKPGQEVQINRKKYTYEGVKKVRKNGASVQKIVFQGAAADDQVLYNLNDGGKKLTDVKILIW